jgi:hypothetical protein
LGAISNPTHDQNAANSAMPDAAAPNTLIAPVLPKTSAGLSGAIDRPSAPPWARIEMPSTSRASTSATSITPSTFAVSSMWNQARALMIASPAAVYSQAGSSTPVHVCIDVAAK